MGSTRLLRKLLERVAVTLIAGGESLLESFLTLLIAYRCDDQRFAIGRDFEGGPFVDAEQIKNRALDHQSQTIAMPAQFFSIAKLLKVKVYN